MLHVRLEQAALALLAMEPQQVAQRDCMREAIEELLPELKSHINRLYWRGHVSYWKRLEVLVPRLEKKMEG